MQKRYFFLILIFLLIIFFSILLFVFFSLKKWDKKKMKVIGFLPYWNINNDYQPNIKILNQLIYFSLTFDNNGKIVKKNNPQELEPGWYIFAQNKSLKNIINQAKKEKVKILVSISQFDAEITDAVLNDKYKRHALIKELINLISLYSLDGLDIDIEYFKEEDNVSFRENYSLFLYELKKQMKYLNPNLILSVDIYPKALIKKQPYDLEQIKDTTDQLIIMAYDFTQSNSLYCGPISPLDKEEKPDSYGENYSVKETVFSALEIFSPEKIILGLPLYGYLWQTETDAYRSKAINYGLAKTITYAQAEKLIEEKNLPVFWSQTSQSPYLVYEEEGIINQLYFENLRSLKIKIDLAKKRNLAGIAFWALGYEGQSNKEIWELIENK